jgi:hypothetical protein
MCDFSISLYFSQLLNVLRVSDVRQIEMHAAELLVPYPSPQEVEIATATLERYKLLGCDQILAELIKENVKHYDLRSINSLIVLGMRKN